MSITVTLFIACNYGTPNLSDVSFNPDFGKSCNKIFRRNYCSFITLYHLTYIVVYVQFGYSVLLFDDSL